MSNSEDQSGDPILSEGELNTMQAWSDLFMEGVGIDEPLRRIEVQRLSKGRLAALGMLIRMIVGYRLLVATPAIISKLPDEAQDFMGAIDLYAQLATINASGVNVEDL